MIRCNLDLGLCIVTLIVYISLHAQVMGELTLLPENITSEVGKTAKFPCMTTHDIPVNWMFQGSASNSQMPLFIGGSVVHSFTERFTVKTAVHGEYTLIIHNVAFSDSGSYICVDYSGFGEHASASLAVLESGEVPKNGESTLDTALSKPSNMNPSVIAAISLPIAVVVIVVLVIPAVAVWYRYARRPKDPDPHDAGNVAATLLQQEYQSRQRCDGTSTPIRTRNTAFEIGLQTYTTTRIEDAKRCKKSDHSGIGHLYISYEWKFKDSVFDICKRLKKLGYKVKIDEDRMPRLPKFNTLKGYSNVAVTDADAIIVCLSLSYKDNQTCEAELKYATQLKKPLILLMVDKKWHNSRGWLETITTANNILDFTDPASFDISTPDLAKALGNAGKKGVKKENVKLEKEYLTDPTEITHDMQFQNQMLRGITVMYQRLFLVRENCEAVEVYDENTFSPLGVLPVEGLCTPRDIDSSTKYSCLYIVNFRKNCVHRVELGGEVTQWCLKDTPRGISVARDGYNVVIAFAESRVLRQYTTHGQIVRAITLDDTMLHPFHGIQLSSGGFVVCHGCDSNRHPHHRVCFIDVEGRIVEQYGNTPGSKPGQIHIPERMEVDRNGFILLSEVQNQRVILLYPDLSNSRVLIGPRAGRDEWDIRRLCFNEESGRLYLIEWRTQFDVPTDSQLCVFQIK